MAQTVTKQIEIALLRISADGKLLEFIINAPSDFHLTEFYITIVGKEDTIYSIGSSLFTAGDAQDSAQGAVDLESINVTKPEIYHILIEAEPDSTNTTDTDPIETDAYISDVSGVYKCLIDDIVAFDNNCGDTSILDRVIRNYLMLYGHQEALHLGYLGEAKNWFDKLSKCFSSCGERVDRPNLGCGCSSSPVSYCNSAPAPKPSCGCGR